MAVNSVVKESSFQLSWTGFSCITDGIYSWLVMSVKQHRDPCSGLPVDCVQTPPCLEKKKKNGYLREFLSPILMRGGSVCTQASYQS